MSEPTRGIGGVKSPVSQHTHDLLWRALVTALGVFVRAARQHLDMRAQEKCPRCGHTF